MDVHKELARLSINPDMLKDQFFLTNERVAEQLIDIAGVNKNDRVLEVGAGLGLLTHKLAERAKEVIAIEWLAIYYIQ
jgi:16S rRNA (adenine1518-N6/adenine1519-N6)-dimethyltransferase